VAVVEQASQDAVERLLVLELEFELVLDLVSGTVALLFDELVQELQELAWKQGEDH